MMMFFWLFARCRPYFLSALGAGCLVFQGLEIAKALLGSRKGFFRIQRVGWVLSAWVMGSGVLGAQVLGANSGVLVFKPWGCVQNMLVRFGSNFHWETKNGSTKFKDLAEGKRTLSSPHGAAWDLPNG